ncbi:LAME_0B04962g1_1 [Lachancea meyersii CBS 8951]|uniref:LAME_0B04962g1_1 n=1 Tax=Lachancea meyersii CBS 8951 TaxID=1266667 RepID=A0A1G4IV92_9SACH|nr:LAME_0B04962g1_1 [Lachancea meyersii CBS 8951]
MTLEKLPEPFESRKDPPCDGADAPKLPPLGKWNVPSQVPSTPVSHPSLNLPKTSRFRELRGSSSLFPGSAKFRSATGGLPKSKPLNQYQISQVEARKLEWSKSSEPDQNFTSESGWHYVLKKGSVPCFKIPRSQLPDPLTFYEQVESVGSRYGAVILEIIEDPQVTSEPPAIALNPDLFRFKARKQSLRPFQIETRRKLDFYRKLHHFHTMRGDKNLLSNLHKIPSIDRRPLDLYRLRECVLLRGGYQAVCAKKLWAQISRELGYSERASNSLLTTLRSAYTKILADFDEYSLKNDLTGSIAQQDMSSKLHIVLPSSITNEAANSKSKKRGSVGTTIVCDNRAKKRKFVTPKVFELIGTGIEYPRLRDVLQYKGCVTKFETLTDRRKHITRPSTSTLPSYDFSFWKNTTEIYDKSLYETSDSPIYTLTQFCEKSHLHSKQFFERCAERLPVAISDYHRFNVDSFERLFFQVLSDIGVSCDVDTAINLPARIHGSGFTSVSHNGDDMHNANSWALKNISVSEKSALCFLNADYGDQVYSHLDVGMLFSVKGWAVEDNFLPAVDYHHVGSSKLWYIIPPHDLEKFEQLISNSKGNINSSKAKTDTINDGNFQESVLYQCFSDTTPDSLPSGRPTRINTHSIHPVNITFEHLSSDIQFPPEVFEEHNIEVLKVVQNPRSYLFKFPKTYTMNLHSGFNVSENVHFAPASWLKVVLDSEAWLSNHGILPAINPFQLSYNIISQCKSKSLVSKAREIFLPLVADELKARNEFNRMTSDIKVYTNTFDYISDLNFASTGASKVLLTNESDCITLSLRQFLDNSRIENGTLHVFGRDLESEQISLSLHLLYPSENLEFLLQEDQARLKAAATFYTHEINREEDTKAEIIQSYTKLVGRNGGESRIRLDEINMYTEALSEVQASLSKPFNQIISEVRAIRSKCVQFLKSVNGVQQELWLPEVNSGFALHEISVPRFQHSAAELFKLQNELQHLSVEFTEMHDIFDLCRRVKEYQNFCKDALQKEDLDLLQNAYMRGLSLGISSKYHKLLARTIGEKLWLKEYEKVFSNNLDLSSQDAKSYNIKDLPVFLNYGLRYVRGKNHSDKFHEVRRAILVSQNVLSELKGLFKKKTSRIPAEKLQELFTTINKHPHLIDARLSDALEAILKAFDSSKQSFASSFTKLSTNDQFLIQLGADATAETLCELNLLDKFDGSTSDHRLTLQEVPNKSIFSKHIKDCRAWLHVLLTIVPKKQSWAKILLSTEQCMGNKADTWNAPTSVHDEKEGFYCFCRRGDFGSTMVACEICGEWYHMTCINKGKWSLGSSESSVFVCPICCARDVPNINAVRYDDLQKLILESSRLKIIPDRQLLSEVFQVFKIAAAFRRELRESMFESDGRLKLDVPLSKVKYYVRKLTGSGVKMIQEEEALRSACREHDALRIQAFLLGKINVVTGFEVTDQKVSSPAAAASEKAPTKFIEQHKSNGNDDKVEETAKAEKSELMSETSKSIYAPTSEPSSQPYIQNP